MATTTPNYGWSVPTSTDLVKNGATAIETLGDSIDASMADLRGGTTGQVLAKATNTDMDFTWTTPSGGTNSFYAGKNKIINGDFFVNQRSFTSNTTSVYGFDRWAQSFSGGTSVTNSAQTFTLGAAPVAGYEGKNFNRQVTLGQSGANDYAQIIQRIESVRTLANQTATISFYAKAATGTPKISVELQQVFGTGGSPSAGILINAGQVTITTSWVRYSVTVNVPSISGKTIGTNNDDNLTLALWTSSGSTYNARTGSMGIQNNTFDFWGVQVEAGSTATDFVTASGGSPQAELAMCQRYYYRRSANATNTYAVLSDWGVGTGSANAVVPVFSPSTMRVSPTAVDYGGTFRLHDGTNGSSGAVTFTITTIYNNPNNTYLNCSTGSGVTQYRPTQVQASNDATAYLGLSAEL